MLGQEGIYCAPFLYSWPLVRVGGAGPPTWLLIVMILASQSFFFFVLTRLPNILKQGFQPAFSAPHLPNHYHSYFAQDGSGNLETSISGLSGTG